MSFKINVLLVFALFLSVLFANEAQGQTYFLNGSAISLGADCYQLTGELTTQNGTVWYGDQLNLNQPFDLMFQMNFGDIDANGADGICFVLQTVGTNAIGESGGGMGYLNFGTGSLGIEFDTWQNGENGDPFQDHVAIERDGDINHNSTSNIAGPVNIDPFGNNVEDGLNHTVQITWDPATQTINVYYDCVFRLAGQVDLIGDVFGGQSLVYWGFTAATGGSFNNQTVCLQENILSVGDQVDICTGASAILSAGSSADGTYSWTPVDFLDDPNSATPTATPPVTTTYSVNFTDLCGNQVDADITVVVEDLVITIPNLPEITCLNPNVVVQVESNLNLLLNYNWAEGPTSILEGLNEDNITLNSPGTYFVTADFEGFCSSSISFEIVENLTPYSVDITGLQQLDCNNIVSQITATSNGTDAQFFWTSGGNIFGSNPSIQVSNEGTYNVTVVNPSNGCTSAESIVITSDFAQPNISTSLQDSLTCIRPSITLEGISVSNATDYSISWNAGLGNIVSGSNTLAPLVNSAGEYEITVTSNENGCSSSEIIDVYQDEDFSIDLSFMLFPNIITPNGDQKNSNWQPFLLTNPGFDLLEIFDTYELQVFNRWGTAIFETTNPKAWKANDVEDGVYFYILKYSTNCGNGASGEQTGNIEVIR